MLHVRICAGALGNQRPYRDTFPICGANQELTQ